MTVQESKSNGEWTIGRLLEWTRRHLEAAGVEEPRLAAELLLAKAVGCPRIQLYARFDAAPPDEQRAVFRDLVRRAAQHYPIAYLIGRKEFYSLDFLVTPDVLIPRPETELLVEHALVWCREHPQDGYEILDLGTGSGCIAVCLAKRLPAAHVTATDVSEPALEIARRNAAQHGVTTRIVLIRADWFQFEPGLALGPSRAGTSHRLLAGATQGRSAGATQAISAGATQADRDGGSGAAPVFDLVLSNPPYVAEAARHSLPPNVRDHEPGVALLAGGDGLDAFRKIAAGVRAHLRPGGCLMIEVGCGQADEVESLLVESAGLRPVARHKDLAGIERALQLTLPT